MAGPAGTGPTQRGCKGATFCQTTPPGNDLASRTASGPRRQPTTPPKRC